MKLTKDIEGCSGGALYPATFAAGSTCPDDLLPAALELGALSEDDAAAAVKRLDEIEAKARKAARKALENKAHAGSGEQA
jgi:hypothetical protein